jgi:hypothetical protein
MDKSAVYLAINGVSVLLVSLISGRWFSKAITTQGNEVAWRVVHSGGSMGGIMLIAFSSLVSLLVLPHWAMSLFVWSTIIGIWLFILAMIAAAVTGERGLTNGGTQINRGVYHTYIVASFSSLLGCGILLAGLYRAL